MENGFRTALLGGFRKKDVVSYLAEEKQRQAEELDAAQERLAAKERELSDAAALQSDAERRAAALLEQVNDLQTRESARAGELDALHQRESGRRAEIDRLREEIAARDGEILRLKEALAAVQENYDGLRQGSEAEKQELSRRLSAMEAICARLSKDAENAPVQRQSAASGDTIGVLCNRVERAMSQLERLLEGPYRLVPVEREQPPESAGEAPEMPAAPSEEPPAIPEPETAARRDASSFARLMEQIRRRRP